MKVVVMIDSVWLKMERMEERIKRGLNKYKVSCEFKIVVVVLSYMLVGESKINKLVKWKY